MEDYNQRVMAISNALREGKVTLRAAAKVKIAAINTQLQADIFAIEQRAKAAIAELTDKAAQEREAKQAAKGAAKLAKPTRLTKAQIRQQAKWAAYRAEVKANPSRYWSHRMYDNTLPPDFDWDNLPPVPEDGADDDIDFT